jgi:hypothetical protein
MLITYAMTLGSKIAIGGPPRIIPSIHRQAQDSKKVWGVVRRSHLISTMGAPRRSEDEFVWVVEGEVVLVTSYGEEVLTSGTAPNLICGWRARRPHIQNRSNQRRYCLRLALDDQGRTLAVIGATGSSSTRPGNGPE